MSDKLEHYMKTQKPTADRPLQGMTLLVVEDSRFASEAIRLLSLRSGARIRRADSLGAAFRHLRAYRPTIVIVDMGLPDGSGAELITELSHDSTPVPALLGMSADEDNAVLALRAGAHGFLAKPVESLAVFQHAILSLLPPQMDQKIRLVPKENIAPDAVAYHDDLSHVASLMRQKIDGPTQDYIAQFLGALGQSAHDQTLWSAAADLAQARADGEATAPDLEKVESLLRVRLAERKAV